MTDDLRQKLTNLAARDMYQREGVYEQPGCPWDDLFDVEHRQWREAVTPTIDAMMPVITKALADAWDHGYLTSTADYGNDPEADADKATPNPWRQP